MKILIVYVRYSEPDKVNDDIRFMDLVTDRVTSMSFIHNLFTYLFTD